MLGLEVELHRRISEIFEIILSISSFMTYEDINCGWFVSNLLFERSLIAQSIRDISRSNGNNDNCSKSSEVESKDKKELEYREEKKLL